MRKPVAQALAAGWGTAQVWEWPEAQLPPAPMHAQAQREALAGRGRTQKRGAMGEMRRRRPQY